jgi:predicted lipid-binding transport protein (Tim44 family)
MSDFLDLPTLIIIGVTIFVLVRLRSVLGTRTGTERPPSERIRDKKDGDDTVVPLRPRDTQPAPGDLEAERRQRKIEAEIEQFSHGDTELAEGLKAIAATDPDFTPKSFLEGAKSAYEMIITAYAQGDRRTLKNLLEKDVYEGFDAAISEREANGHTVDFTFVGLPKIEMTTATVDKRYAQLSIRFNAEIVSATRDKDGELVEGNADQVVTIADEWTFGRNTKSRDPNWKLVATDRLD